MTLTLVIVKIKVKEEKVYIQHNSLNFIILNQKEKRRILLQI